MSQFTEWAISIACTLPFLGLALLTIYLVGKVNEELKKPF